MNQNSDKTCWHCKKSLFNSEFHTYRIHGKYVQMHMRCWRKYMKENKPATTQIICETCGQINKIDINGNVWSSYKIDKERCWYCERKIARNSKTER